MDVMSYGLFITLMKIIRDVNHNRGILWACLVLSNWLVRG